MQRALRVVRVRDIRRARVHRLQHFRAFRARMPDRHHHAFFFQMTDKTDRAVHFGRKRDDLNAVSARFVVLVENFRVRRGNVFEGLRAFMRRGDKRTFEMNPRDTRTLFAARFTIFFHRAHRF